MSYEVKEFDLDEWRKGIEYRHPGSGACQRFAQRRVVKFDVRTYNQLTLESTTLMNFLEIKYPSG